jgi:nitroimidazol reductase NimA-like FMN-containing flavoprotein (pyridoxamine 5'-phosphate oxidase superfamily)
LEDFAHLIFATYRNTRKYTNLKQNEKVSILFEYKKDIDNGSQEIIILTAFGKAKEVEETEYNGTFNAHLMKHPELKPFLLSSDCALFRVKVEAYQLVLGIDDVSWLNIK